MKVIAPASGCLIELAYNGIYWDRVHVPPSVKLDFLFYGLHRFVGWFDQREVFPRLARLDDADTESQKFKPLLTGSETQLLTTAGCFC